MKINSIIDVITNSSTEIFTWMDTSFVQTIKPAFEKMMEMMGVDGKFEDYFILRHCLKPKYLDDYLNGWKSGIIKKLWDEFLSKNGGGDTKEIRADFSNFVNELYRSDQLPEHDKNSDNNEAYYYQTLEFKLKDTNVDFLEVIMKSVCSEERDI